VKGGGCCDCGGVKAGEQLVVDLCFCMAGLGEALLYSAFVGLPKDWAWLGAWP